MKKKILTLITICLILVCFSINVFSANEVSQNEIIEGETNSEATNKTLFEQKTEVDNKLNESNTRLEYVQSEISASMQKVQELDDSINDYQNKYNELQSQIASLEAEISSTQNDLTKTEQEYVRKENLLKKRVVALYEGGETTYLDVLLSSKNLFDFLSNYYMIEQIIEFDSNLLNELDEQKQNIEVKKAEQEKKKTDLRVAKAKQGQMQILMENQKTLQVSYASKLSEEEKTLYEQIEQYKKEQEDLENQIQAAINWSGALAIQYKGGVMLWPIAVDGTYITSPYGNRLHPIQGVYRYHDGIDIGNAGYGAPVIAAADGIVTYAGVMSGYGNCVMINHGDGIVTLYGHGQEIYTELGATVKQGDVIMAVGSTGNSTGPHLHFEVRKFGVAVDPIPYLQGNNANNNTIENENENVNNNQTINDT